MATTSFRENVIDWFNRDQTVNFTFNQLRIKNQLEKMIADGDENIKITARNEDGTITGTMPLSYIKITKPNKRNLTQEQRQAVADRFRKAREESESK